MRTVGKTGTVRLTGKDLGELRTFVFERDGGYCVKCGCYVTDEVPDWHEQKYHMAHIQGRGAGGSDVPENVECLCGKCHLVVMHRGGKVVPAKSNLPRCS